MEPLLVRWVLSYWLPSLHFQFILFEFMLCWFCDLEMLAISFLSEVKINNFFSDKILINFWDKSKNMFLVVTVLKIWSGTYNTGILIWAGYNDKKMRRWMQKCFTMELLNVILILQPLGSCIHYITNTKRIEGEGRR